MKDLDLYFSEPDIDLTAVIHSDWLKKEKYEFKVSVSKPDTRFYLNE